MVAKLGVGIVGHSEALVADGLHSGADVLASIAVVMGLRVAGRPPDSDHQYGHGKAEAIAQKVVAVFLLLAGLEVVNMTLESWSHAVRPSILALIVAAAAVIPKALMAWAQSKLARVSGSHAILAEMRDNETDALASLVAALGILIARWGPRSADSVAALGVAGLLFWAGGDVFRTAAHDLMDEAADAAIETDIRARVLGTLGVLNIATLRTRMNGSQTFVDLEIVVARDLSLVEAHTLAHGVERTVMEMTSVQGVTVHVNPAEEGGQM